MLVYSAILAVLAFGYVSGDYYNCSYLDAFGKHRLRHCDTGCCGSIHHAYCCHHKYLAEIIFGSILGFFILVVIIVVTVHCCYRRGQIKLEILRVTRNYGTINVQPDDTESANNNNTEPPPQNDRVIVPEVEITVTPATPQEAKLNPVGTKSEIPAIEEETSVNKESENENVDTALEKSAS